MQQQTETRRFSLLNMLMWFLGSMALAFFVWIIATLESDPINASIFRNVPIQIQVDEGLIITDQSRRVVSVNVRAPQSILDQLDTDDIQVIADMHQLGSGEHRVDLQALVSRRADPDPSPRWVIVELEEAREQLVPVEVQITSALPPGFEIQDGEPVLETRQVLVSGPLSMVQQVAATHVSLNLEQRRNPFSDEIRVIPVDLDGNIVEGVTVEPPLIEVSVPIQTRSDIRQVSVVPNIQLETLPEGYALSSIEYAPQVVLLRGPPEPLRGAPGTLFTTPIELTGRTGTFEETVNVLFPNELLFIVGPQTVNVSIAITPLLSSRQFDPVPVEVIGLTNKLAAVLSPQEITVLITGPQIALDDLDLDDIRAVIDLNGLDEGNYQIPAQVSVNLDPGQITNISVLPSEVDVDIEASAAPSSG
jgi:YbbR domain-containing protein